VETPHLHTASLTLFARAGSRYESEKSNGLSHFTEHMLFRGSKAYPSSFALNTAIEELGGTLYAETGRDHSLYQVSLGPRGLPNAMEILGGLFSDPVFGEIEAERRLVLEEILEDFDDRGRLINVTDIARQMAFGNHPLGYSILGPSKNVRAFSQGDVRRHFARLYGANNLLLCVGGPVSATEVGAHARRCFGSLRPGKAARAKAAPPAVKGSQLKTVATDSAQSQIQILFRGLAAQDADCPALVVLLRLIDDGMATPLHYRISDQKGLAYSISADNDSFSDTSLIEFDAACSPANLSPLVHEILDIVRGFAEDETAPELLRRAKRRYREDLEASFDDVPALCSWFGGSELFMRPQTHAQRMKQIAAVSSTDIKRVAQRVFRRDGLCAVVAGSFDKSEVARVRSLFKKLP